MIVLAAAGLLTLTAVIQLLTYRDTIQDSDSQELGPANVLTLTDSVMHQVEGDTLRMQVWAEQTIYVEERRRARLSRVRFTAYPSPEQKIPREPIHGVANQADVQGNGSIIDLEGDVHIAQGTKLEMRGQRLRYNHKTGLITSRDPIWMRNGATVQQGASAEYSIRDETLKMTRPQVWE